MSHWNTAQRPGSAALDQAIEAVIRRGVYILSTALVLIGLPVWLIAFTSVPAGTVDLPTFNPDASLTTERIADVGTSR